MKADMVKEDRRHRALTAPLIPPAPLRGLQSLRRTAPVGEISPFATKGVDLSQFRRALTSSLTPPLSVLVIPVSLLDQSPFTNSFSAYTTPICHCHCLSLFHSLSSHGPCECGPQELSVAAAFYHSHSGGALTIPSGLRLVFALPSSPPPLRVRSRHFLAFDWR